MNHLELAILAVVGLVLLDLAVAELRQRSKQAASRRLATSHRRQPVQSRRVR